MRRVPLNDEGGHLDEKGGPIDECWPLDQQVGFPRGAFTIAYMY